MSAPQQQPPQTDEELVLALRQDIVRISEGKFRLDEVAPGVNIFDYGYVSSLTAVMLLGDIEERYGVAIEDLDLIEELFTLNDLAARIRQQS